MSRALLLVCLLLVSTACTRADGEAPATSSSPPATTEAPGAEEPDAPPGVADPTPPAQDAAQGDAPVETSSPPEPDPPETARSVLERAAVFQRGTTPRPAPRSLHGRFYVFLRTEDGSMVRADVERWFGTTPERMRTTTSETITGATSTETWSEGVAWFQDSASGTVHVYSDDPATFGEDLRRLQEQVRLTRLMLQAAVLDALLPELDDLAVAGRAQHTDLDGETHAVTVVRARVADELFGSHPDAPPPLPDEPGPRLALRFAVDDETGTLWELAVAAPHRPDIADLALRFDFHAATAGGLRVPGNIRVFRAGEDSESIGLGVGVDEQGRPVFHVDAPLDEALFARP